MPLRSSYLDYDLKLLCERSAFSNILGNSEAALHAHVFPRYATEPEERRKKPAWFYDWKSSVSFDAERDRKLMQELAEAIQRYQDAA
jgi:hypothetical protein